MTTIIEADEQGTLHIPADVLGVDKPKTRYVVKRVHGVLISRPEDKQLHWDNRSPEERAAAFLEWANRPRSYGPSLSDEALRRENMYE